MNKAETKKLLEEFSQAKLKEYGSYAYSSGYFEIMLGNALERLTKRQRESMLAQIVSATATSQKQEIVQSVSLAQ
jgi:hypothetical protein